MENYGNYRNFSSRDLHCIPLDALSYAYDIVELNLSSNHLESLLCCDGDGDGVDATETSRSNATMFDWSLLSHIRHLDLSSNAFPRIPIEQLGQMSSTLESLLMGGNHLKIVDFEMGKESEVGSTSTPLYPNMNLNSNLQMSFAALRTLDVSFNDISLISDSIADLHATLTIFRARNNIIEHLTPAISQLTNLVELDISHNRLKMLPIDAIEHVALVKFNGNPLEYPPGIACDDLYSLEDLRQILSGGIDNIHIHGDDQMAADVNENENQNKSRPLLFDKEKDVIARMENRIESAHENGSRTLDLDGMGLHKAPILEIKECEFDIVVLSNNLLGYHESDGADMQLQRDVGDDEDEYHVWCLEELNLSGNALSVLDDGPSGLDMLFYERLPSLKLLDISNNQLSTIDISASSKWRSLHTLLASNNVFSTIPECLTLACDPDSSYLANSLQNLDLSDNQLDSLDVGLIGALTALTQLKMAGNRIKEIPSEISMMTRLQKLDISRNNLEILPNEIGSMVSLETLIVSENELSTLPGHFRLLRNLQVLVASSNRINCLWPEGDLALPELKRLDLSRNSITIEALKLGSLKLCKGLNDVNLNHNQLKEFPGVNELPYPALHRLSLEGNEISTLTLSPETLRTIGSLTSLILDKNSIEVLPPALCTQAVQLRVLSMSSNRVSSIPASILHLRQLEELRLARNNINSLPHSLGNLTHLAVLDLDGNPLGALPPSKAYGVLSSAPNASAIIEYLRTPESMSVAANNIQIDKFIEYVYKEGWSRISLSRCRLSNVPSMLWKHSNAANLVQLSLDNNLLQTLPYGMHTLVKNLRGLDLSGNLFTSFPIRSLIGYGMEMEVEVDGEGEGEDRGEKGVMHTGKPKWLQLNWMSALGKPSERSGHGHEHAREKQGASKNGSEGEGHMLQSLKIHNNQIRSLPHELSQMTSLKVLGAGNCMLESETKQIVDITQKTVFSQRAVLTTQSLPPAIFVGCTQLTSLALWHNRLAGLPSEIGYLAALKELDVSHNEMTSLPREIGLLFSLERLHAGGNKLVELPIELQACPRLTHLCVSHNHLTTVEGDILRGMVNLKCLYMNNNAITSLPAELWQCGELTEIDVSYNTIPAFIGLDPQSSTTPHDVLQHMNKLRVLRFSHNKLMELPWSLFDLQNLNELDLSHNKIQELSFVPTWKRVGLKKLINVDVDGNGVGGIGIEGEGEDTVAGDKARSKSKKRSVQRQGLIKLNVAYNSLRTLSSTIHHISTIEYLNLDGNMLSYLPKQLGQLPHLKYLSVWGNSLRSIPEELGHCLNLRTLYVGENEIRRIPPQIMKTRIRVHGQIHHGDGDIEYNYSYARGGNASASGSASASASGSMNIFGLMAMPRSWSQAMKSAFGYRPSLQGQGAVSLVEKARGSRGKTKAKVSWKEALKSRLDGDGDGNDPIHLDLSGLGLSQPMQKQDFETVSISDGEEMSKVSRVLAVSSINLSNNLLDSSCLLSIDVLASTLTAIDLRCNALNTIPTSLCRLTNLVTLHLDVNSITNMPFEISVWKKLEVLCIGANRLTTIPVAIRSCTALKRVEFWRNALTNLSIPPEIGSLTSISELNLDYNAMTDLPVEIGSMYGLHSLTISFNRITSLPSSLSQLSALRVLMCNGNEIENINCDFSGMPTLYQLDLRHNKISVIPESIGTLERLNVLHLDDNHIRELPTSIGNCTALTLLSVSHNNLIRLPPSIHSLSSLRILDADGNNLEQFPENRSSVHGGMGTGTAASGLVNLTELSLDNNQLVDMPVDLPTMHRLMVLRLGGNKLSKVNKDIGTCTSLTELRLDDNLLTSLPNELSKCGSLSILTCQDNYSLVHPPQSIVEKGIESIMKYLKLQHYDPLPVLRSASEQRWTSIDLTGRNLYDVPNAVCELVWIKELNLYGNNLGQCREQEQEQDMGIESRIRNNMDDSHSTSTSTSIYSFSFDSFTHLTALDIGGNKLTEIPKPILHLSLLKELRLEANKIVRIPPNISLLEHLEVLNLSGNCLRGDLDSLFASEDHDDDHDHDSDFKITTLGDLQCLHELDLSCNSLTNISNDICKITSLRVLRVASNPNLERLPSEIGIELVNLEVIDACFCSLERIPRSICSTSTLKCLNISSNKLKSIHIGDWPMLEELHLAHNYLDDIPNISGLTSLKILLLNNNRLTDISYSLNLNTTKNTKKNSNDDLSVSVPGSMPMPIQELALSHNNLIELPIELYTKCASTLERLYLDGNLVHTLPKEFGMLTSLKTLTMAGDQLQSVPECLFSCVSLEEIVLAGNQLYHIPSQLVRLPLLRIIDISHNYIRTLPQIRDNVIVRSEGNPLKVNFS